MPEQNSDAMARRTARMKGQVKALGIAQAKIAKRLGISATAVGNFINGSVLYTSYWRQIASMLDIPEDEMRSMMAETGGDPAHNEDDAENLTYTRGRVDIMTQMDRDQRMSDAETRTMGRGRKTKQGLSDMLPALGVAIGGEDGEFVLNGKETDLLARPAQLDGVPDAYCVYVSGESMEPKYRASEVAYVHPGRPPRRGDGVVVQIKPSAEGEPPHAFVKEFVGWAGNRLVLRQYNPPKDIEFDSDSVVSVHPIILSGAPT